MRGDGSLVPKAMKDAKAIEVAGLINGRTAGSLLEWRAAQALWRLGWRFQYQVPLMGGRDRSGGQVLDFLIMTTPVWTAMPVNGRYWHNAVKEEYQISEMMEALKQAGYPVGREALILWEENATTADAATQWLYMHIGRG
jgi:hypothetical protein